MNDGLTDEDREGIQSVLATCPKVQKAILFGSRAMGTFRSASDVDIALEGEGLTLLICFKSKSKFLI